MCVGPQVLDFKPLPSQNCLTLLERETYTVPMLLRAFVATSAIMLLVVSGSPSLDAQAGLREHTMFASALDANGAPVLSLDTADVVVREDRTTREVLRVVPAIERSPSAPRAWSLLRRSVRLEALALVVAIALTAVLVNVTPARNEAGIGGIFSETVPLGDIGSVNVVVDPNQAGRNAVHLYFYDEDGRAADLTDDVSLSLSLPADDIGPIVREPFRAGPNHFQIDGDELVTGGRWVIAVTSAVSRFEEATAEVEVLVGD